MFVKPLPEFIQEIADFGHTDPATIALRARAARMMEAGGAGRDIVEAQGAATGRFNGRNPPRSQEPK